MNIKNKHIVITGGTGGIGLALSQQLHNLGANLSLISRHHFDDLPVHLINADLANYDGISTACEALKNRPVDVLINLAGVQYCGLVEQECADHMAQLQTLNLLAPMMLSSALIPRMKQQKQGHIINVGSIFGMINHAYFVNYSASKAGLKGFSEALRRELKPDGINVTYLCPRAVQTKLNTGKIADYADLTQMHMDQPEWVAEQIVEALRKNKTDVFLGFPERFFVGLNALLPRLVDKALYKTDKKARALFQ